MQYDELGVRRRGNPQSPLPLVTVLLLGSLVAPGCFTTLRNNARLERGFDFGLAGGATIAPPGDYVRLSTFNHPWGASKARTAKQGPGLTEVGDGRTAQAA